MSSGIRLVTSHIKSSEKPPSLTDAKSYAIYTAAVTISNDTETIIPSYTYHSGDLWITNSNTFLNRGAPGLYLIDVNCVWDDDGTTVGTRRMRVSHRSDDIGGFIIDATTDTPIAGIDTRQHIMAKSSIRTVLPGLSMETTLYQSSGGNLNATVTVTILKISE